MSVLNDMQIMGAIITLVGLILMAVAGFFK